MFYPMCCSWLRPTIRNQPPVSTNHSVKPIFVTQQIGYDFFIVPKGHFFRSLANRKSIVRHDLGSLCRKNSFFKWNQMIVKVISRIYLFCAIWEMSVLSIFLWPASRKVFGHTSHTILIDTISLKTKNVCFRKFCTQFSILSKCPIDSSPSWFCSQISHWRKGQSNT